MPILGKTLLKRRTSSFLLDGVSNVIHGYSLRKLLSTYNGYCIEVGTNGAYSNIGFLNNSLNTSQLYIGEGWTTIVPVLYDQVGSASLVQSPVNSTTLQPIILSSGTLQTAGGKPTLSFNNQNLISTANIPQTPLTIIAVVAISGSTNGAFVKCGDSGSGIGIGVGNGSTFDTAGVGIVGLNETLYWITETGTSISTSEMAIVEINSNGSSSNVYLNGVLISTGGNCIAPANNYYLGGYTASNGNLRFPTCKISENIVFNAVISSSVRASLVANMKSYYSII